MIDNGYTSDLIVPINYTLVSYYFVQGKQKQLENICYTLYIILTLRSSRSRPCSGCNHIYIEGNWIIYILQIDVVNIDWSTLFEILFHGKMFRQK